MGRAESAETGTLWIIETRLGKKMLDAINKMSGTFSCSSESILLRPAVGVKSLKYLLFNSHNGP